MRPRLNDRKLAKIFVQSYQNPLLLVRMVQDFIVSRILRPIARPDHVVSGDLKRVAYGFGNASVDEQLHEAESAGHGSTRSCPTNRRA
jgi:hypothetical protein